MDKKDTRSINGNAAVAEAMRQINPDVFGFYPITPTSYIGSIFSQQVSNGEVDTEYVCAESEHAALSVCVGASAAGGRAVTATASQGLILMSEVLWNASGMRLPILLINGNREVGAPLSIHCGHSDIMGVRDSGWIQLFAKNPQEAYDFTLCGFPIAEEKSVRTPIMVAMDCFHTTHTQMPVEIEPDKKVAEFIGETLQLNSLLDIENPVAYGNFDRPEYFMNHKKEQVEGMMNALPQVKKVFENFAKSFKKDEYKVVEEIKNEDSEVVFVGLGSVVGTLEVAISKLREKGIKAGIINPRLFRPLPVKEIKDSLKNAKKVIVLDRVSPSGASFSPLMDAVLSVFRNDDKPQIKNVIYGLGSHETPSKELIKLVEKFDDLPDTPHWICD